MSSSNWTLVSPAGLITNSYKPYKAKTRVECTWWAQRLHWHKPDSRSNEELDDDDSIIDLVWPDTQNSPKLKNTGSPEMTFMTSSIDLSFQRSNKTTRPNDILRFLHSHPKELADDPLCSVTPMRPQEFPDVTEGEGFYLKMCWKGEDA